MSVSAFHHQFKSITGTTPLQLLEATAAVPGASAASPGRCRCSDGWIPRRPRRSLALEPRLQATVRRATRTSSGAYSQRDRRRERFDSVVFNCTEAERNNRRLVGRGEAFRWRDLDEDMSVENLLTQARSGEINGRSGNGWNPERLPYDDRCACQAIQDCGGYAAALAGLACK